MFRFKFIFPEIRLERLLDLLLRKKRKQKKLERMALVIRVMLVSFLGNYIFLQV